MTLTPQTVRLDKKCGSSGIPDSAKCSKSTTSTATSKYEPNLGDRIRSGWAGLNAGLSAFTAGQNLSLAVQHKSLGHGIAALGNLGGAALNAKGSSEYLKGRTMQGYLYQVGGGTVNAAGTLIGSSVAESDFRRRQANAVANKSGYTGKDPFKDLGVPSDASAADIRRAYLKMAAKNHPDVGGNKVEFQRLKSAYDEILRRRGEGRGTRDSIWASGFAP